MQIVTSWHDYPGAILGRTETSLLAWFTENVQSGEIWIDAGAHYGYTALALCRLVGSTGKVYAFEPVLSTAGCLTRTRLVNQLSQLFILPFALADFSQMTMVRMPTARGMAYQGSAEPAVAENVLAVSFDTIWDHICDDKKRLDGIKIDVQGMEIKVLQGMQESIREFRPKLVVELHQGVNRSQLIDLLEYFGYSREGVPVDPYADEGTPGYYNDRSYVFVSSC